MAPVQSKYQAPGFFGSTARRNGFGKILKSKPWALNMGPQSGPQDITTSEHIRWERAQACMAARLCT